jgi:hypothetical protein
LSAFRNAATPVPGEGLPGDTPGGRATLAFDATWTQGPGVYGGLTAAAIGLGMSAHVPEGRRLRSMALQYAAPVAPGTAELAVAVERTGSTATFVSARISQEGKVAIQAMATFARDRVAALDEDRVRPGAVLPADRAPDMPYVPGVFPVFLQHFDVRFAAGGAPFAGGAEAFIGLWLRHRDAAEIGVPEVLGMLDTPPPAVLARAVGPRPASTVTFQLHLFDVPEVAPDAFWYVDTTSRITRDGWSDEEIRLFAPGPEGGVGGLVAVGRQLVAILR